MNGTNKMILIEQIRSFFLTIVLTIVLAVTVAFNFGTIDAWAANLPTQLANLNRAEAMTKNIEGKAQEALGNLTGDPKDQLMGKAKQVESQGRNATEDIKDVKIR